MFISSLIHISNVDNLVFLFNMQGYNQDDQVSILELMNDTMDKLNPTWSILSKWRSHYDKPISMVNIRNDAMMLAPNLPLYLSLDDDHKFHDGAGDCYNEIIKFFEEDPELGMVMSAGFLGGYRYKHMLKYAVNKHWMTCKGQFFRNLHKPHSPVYSDEALELCKAGYEDMVIAMEVLADGLKLATHFNNPTYTKATIMESSDNQRDNGKLNRYGENNDDIHNVGVTFSAMELYLKSRFDIEATISTIKSFQPVLTQINNKKKVGMI